MSIQRKNHWKRHMFRKVVGLGTVPSLLAGALCAAPPSLPGLPGIAKPEPLNTEESNLAATEQPQLLPTPTLPPGQGLRSVAPPMDSSTGAHGGASANGETSGVNIKILSALPASGMPINAASPGLSSLPTTASHPSLSKATASKATVMVKMQDTTNAPMLRAEGVVRLPAPPPTSMHSLPSVPVTIANEKASVAGPVKLSIGDDGIVVAAAGDQSECKRADQ